MRTSPEAFGLGPIKASNTKIAYFIYGVNRFGTPSNFFGLYHAKAARLATENLNFHPLC